MFFSYRVGLFPFVSTVHVAAGMSAKDWCDHCIAAAGAGKGGGKAESAMANIPGGQQVLDVVMTAARQYASNKMPGSGVV